MHRRDPLARKAVAAINVAVKRAIDEQKRLGLPVPIWRHGRIEFMASSRASVVRESPAQYGRVRRSAARRSGRLRTAEESGC